MNHPFHCIPKMLRAQAILSKLSSPPVGQYFLISSHTDFPKQAFAQACSLGMHSTPTLDFHTHAGAKRPQIDHLDKLCFSSIFLHQTWQMTLDCCPICLNLKIDTKC